MTNPEDQQRKMGQIIAKAWSNESFKKRLLADATATLKAEGVNVAAGIEVRAVENTATVFHFVLPPKPSSEMSDDDLEQIAGGYGAQDVYLTGFPTVPVITGPLGVPGTGDPKPFAPRRRD